MKKALVFVLVFIMLLSAGCSSAVSVVGASINNEGHLVLSMSDGSTIDAGYARGEQGEQGERGEAGPQGPQGEKGIDGVDGLGIKKAAVNDDGHLMIRLTDDTLIDTGYVVGADGKDGIDGKDGSNGSDGKDGSGNGVLMLADCPVGTTFPCYPDTEFDYHVISFDLMNSNSSIYDTSSGVNVHIDSLTITLTEKNNTNNAVGNFSQSASKYDAFHPYTLTVKATGITSPSLSGLYIGINIEGNSYLYCKGLIQYDGSFTAITENKAFSTAPIEPWVTGIHISDYPNH